MGSCLPCKPAYEAAAKGWVGVPGIQRTKPCKGSRRQRDSGGGGGGRTHWEAAGKGFPLPKGTSTVDKNSRGKENKAVTLAPGQPARARKQIPTQNGFSWDCLLMDFKASRCQQTANFPFVLKIKISKLTSSGLWMPPMKEERVQQS